MKDIVIRVNTAAAGHIIEHFRKCDPDFYKSLKRRTSMEEYAAKIVAKATRYEAWENGSLIGLLAVYYNDEMDFDFITNISVTSEWQGKAIGTKLLQQAIDASRKSPGRSMRLEVSLTNEKARKFYDSFGFKVTHTGEEFTCMSLDLSEA